MPDFLSMGISDALVKKLREQGVVSPTPIQEEAIPAVMDGRDIIAQAQTGTGKTFAFILPVLEKIEQDSGHIQALIVTPTRELALQITDEIEKLIAGLDGINVLAVYGGQDVDKQLKKLRKKIQIVVGTPGRLLDHIRRGTVDLSNISFLVLDEVDQMLHIGFLKEVEDIIRETPAARQTLLFSATIPNEVRKLADKHMRQPQYIQVEKRQGPAQNVRQVAIQTTDRARQGTLIHLIETHRPFLAVVFCRTKRRVSKLYEVLKGKGFQCDELHGDLSQVKREQVMKRFRDAQIQLLIATDVAARGLDVEGVTHVFNYDIPLDPESYIHRSGRTGRAGMTGMAFTLYSPKDRPLLDMIEQELNIRIHKQNAGNFAKEDKKPSSIDETQKHTPRPNGKSSGARTSNRKAGTRQKSEKTKQTGPTSHPLKKKRTRTGNTRNNRTR
ncbi:DEAD/DEAH box helicase [Bacillus sp. T33-2]|uniref:DEAD/DEAH box helicase n=1 Tax=Bacillus sp. T33-2 TaxID=2054168 RepID=UPI000C7618C1|nr:DEAD/DEAH box helicase [Bacillus sp. T33-2]PLR91149.1 DEAD/DEAH box helicase [Bacillus sp. T33-2]